MAKATRARKPVDSTKVPRRRKALPRRRADDFKRFLRYFNLGSNLGNWRTWIATKGPILTRLQVDATWDNANQTGGVLNVYQPPTRGGHAVALVGYDTTSFIVRNSWGPTWGDKGFARASWSYAQAAFTEAYGVSL